MLSFVSANVHDNELRTHFDLIECKTFEPVEARVQTSSSIHMFQRDFCANSW